MSSGLGREVPGRQAQEGPAQEQGVDRGGQEERREAEEGPPAKRNPKQTCKERSSEIFSEERFNEMNKHRQAGKGLFKPVTLSSALAKVTGISGKATRPAVFKALWAYIKKKVACGFPPRSPVHTALRVV